MDLHIEFSEQFEREKLHHQFTASLRILCLTAFALIFGIAFIGDGGNSPILLPLLFGSTFFALACELLAFCKRVSKSALLSSGVLLFLPWILFLTLDASVLSPFPGKAELALCMNAIPLSLFFIAQQQSRNSGRQLGLLAWTITLLTLGIVAGISYQVYISEDFSGTLAMGFLSGFLSDPAAAGAVALLVFFGSFVHATHRGTEPRKRIIALYLALSALALILLTRNTAVWIALLAGSITVAGLYFNRKASRVGISIILACGIALAPLASEMPFANPTKIIAVQDASKASSSDAPSRLELQEIALDIFSRHPVCGAGSGSFESEFEQIAPQQWQIAPTTSNSLYTFILAENGIVGLLLLIIPSAGIAVAAWFAGNRLPRRKRGRHSRYRDEDEDNEFSHANTRSRIAFLLGGCVSVGVLCALDYSPGFFPAILGTAVFGGILMHEIGGSRFNTIFLWEGTKRKAAFALSALIPVGLFALCFPASYSAEQCAIGKQALAPFLPDFYKDEAPSPERFTEADIRLPLLRAVAAQPDNTEAWIALAQYYAYSVYSEPEKAASLARSMFYAANRACESTPQSAQAHFVKAVAEILLRKDADASRSLETAEQLAPNNLPLLYQIAEAHRLLDNESETLSRLSERLSAMAPNSSRVRQLAAVIQLLDIHQNAPQPKTQEALTSPFEI